MGRRNGTSAEQALAASVAANRELRAELETAEKKLAAEQAQLEFHRTELHKAKVELGLKKETIERQERRIDSLTHRLRVEQEHTAGSCSHAADLRELKVTLTALERRVHELQAANEGWYRHEHDTAFLPEESRAAVAATTVLRALGRKQGS